MAANLDDIQQELKSIESQLSKSINASSTQAMEDALRTLIDKMDDINAHIGVEKKKPLQKKNDTNNTINENISKLNGYQKNINSNVQSIATSLKSGSRSLNDAVSYLKIISDHIASGPINQNQNQNNNPSNLQVDFSSVNSNLQDILSEIRNFKAIFTATSGGNLLNGNPNDPLVDKARKVEDAKLDKQAAAIHKEELIKLAAGGDKNAEDELKEIIKQEKAQKKVLEKIEGNTHERTTSKDILEKNKQKRQQWRDENLNGYTIATNVLKGATALGKGGIKSSELIDKGIGAVSQASPLIGGILSLIKMGFDSFAKQQQLGSQYARAVGGGKYGMTQFMRTESNFINRNSTTKNNYTVDEVASALTSISEATGRNTLYQSDANIKSAIDLKRMGIEADTLNMLDTFGKSSSEVDDYFTKLYSSAGKHGLSFSKVSKAVKDNLKMAQTYTFSSGVNGLAKMAESSVQLKYNMGEVGKIAEKVSTLEGATKAGAGLSVLGGEFAMFSDPLQLMYEGLNDMEALNDRMVNMFGDMAYFDRAKGEISVSSFDRQRMRAASEAMGVDFNEMLNLTMNNRKGKMIEQQLGGGLDEDTARFIKNIAQLDENGRAYINGPEGEKRYVGEFNNGDKEWLKRESERYDMGENAKIGDVYNATRDIYDRLDQILNFLSTKLGVWVAKIAGVTWGGDMSRKTYWNNLSKEEKQQYIDKYGSKSAAKSAIGMGVADTAVTNYFGGEQNRQFFNDKWAASWEYHNFAKRIGKGKVDDRIARWAENLTDEEKAKIEERQKRNLLEPENYSNNAYTARNVSSNNSSSSSVSNGSSTSSSPMNFQTVNPNTTAYAPKVTFEPIEVNIKLSGEYKLDGNKIDAKQIDMRSFTDKVVESIKDAHGKVAPLIAQDVMKSYNKAAYAGYNKDADRYAPYGA